MRYCCLPQDRIGQKLTQSEADGAHTGSEEPVFIPHRELDVETLQRLVESVILREGTDYGVREFSLDEKRAHVYGRLERGEARIVFDPTTQTVDIVAALPQRSR